LIAVSALAEAQVEYQDESDPAVDVGFEFLPEQSADIAKILGLSNLPKKGQIVIWTTTPCSDSSRNQALNIHPDIE
jgi:isoleucyl-tRNA synthetase